MTDFKADLRRRISENKPTRWVRFSIVALIFILWVAWIGNWWLALFIFLLFDIYITGYIPFTWWKKSKSKAVRSIMSWVDAIVYALILVYFIFAFIGQNYMIPTSSLEKTLLTGDYLWVNKAVYGPRVPITPIHFPLVHNVFPVLGIDSYASWPENDYHRLKGLRNVEAGDIVVFNYPAGDTVATKFEESDTYYDLVKRYGWERVNTDKATFGEIKYRPVDRRTNYVKRAIGLPGQNLRISNDTIYIDGVAQAFPENVQFRYIISTTKPLTDDVLKELGVSPVDVGMLNPTGELSYVLSQPGFEASNYLYTILLTQSMIDQLTNDGYISGIVKFNDYYLNGYGAMYPGPLAAEWTTSNWGGPNGVVIPKKGLTVPLTEDNWQLYERAIRNYEKHPEAYFKDGKAYIGGKEAKEYTFEMDYYFMMGDNRDNSLDSRFWGFVPEDHIVGTPMFVLISFDRDRGGIRWNRMFKDANPDK